MRFQWEHLAAGAAAIVVLMLTWFAGPIFHVAGANALVLRGGILLLGVLAIIGLLLWARSSRPALPPVDKIQPPAAVSSVGAFVGAAGASQDVDILLREAASKVAAARLASVVTHLLGAAILRIRRRARRRQEPQCAIRLHGRRRCWRRGSLRSRNRRGYRRGHRRGHQMARTLAFAATIWRRARGHRR